MVYLEEYRDLNQCRVVLNKFLNEMVAVVVIVCENFGNAPILMERLLSFEWMFNEMQYRTFICVVIQIANSCDEKLLLSIWNDHWSFFLNSIVYVDNSNENLKDYVNSFLYRLFSKLPESRQLILNAIAQFLSEQNAEVKINHFISFLVQFLRDSSCDSFPDDLLSSNLWNLLIQLSENLIVFDFLRNAADSHPIKFLVNDPLMNVFYQSFFMKRKLF